jgi:release factor glutamine methyltransferase
MDETTFYGLQLITRPGAVMTPRAATERLVDAALLEIGDRPLRVADVGTGSGAIAVALAHLAPQIELWASDTSPEAVALARENARLHGVCKRINLVRGDMLEDIPIDLDLIVANLPYLAPADDYEGEPHCAVFSSGDGLDHYRRLLDAAARHLAHDGLVLIQLHREVHSARRDELPLLLGALIAA